MALDAGATQAEALVHEGDSALTRFANNELHQGVAETDTSVSLRFVDGQRIGVASANRHDDDALRDLARSATDSSLSARRAASATCMPRDAHSRAVASPMPLLAPVMRIALSRRSTPIVRAS